MNKKKNLRICEKGHEFYNSSDCTTCPVCERERIPINEFLSKIGAPARRALETENILTLEKLSTYSEKELLTFHGLGPSSIPKLREELEAKGLNFKNQ
ncbi:MAG: RNA polymerase alpha subunit C-terminal domain-containing protein [Balneolales bacterium]